MSRVFASPGPLYEPEGAQPDYYRLAHAYPQRCLWASNWPHPTQRDRPDERNLLALLQQWARTPEDVRRILHDNPGELYRF